MRYTVKQLSDLAGVSIRTLHYYDEIGLLKPEGHGSNGYRYYGEASVLRLQQVRFFRELDFSLKDIQKIIDRPGFDLVRALEGHRESLEDRMERTAHLIETIDKTILYLKGEQKMAKKELFSGWSEEKQKGYEEEIRQRYGKDAFKGVTDWNSYTKEQKAQIKAEGEAIYRGLLANMDKGYDSPEVQAGVAAWHKHLEYFYKPSYERLRGLAQMYTEHPDFVATFEAMHPEMPQFLYKAIMHYCKDKVD